MINFKEFLEEGVNDYFLYHAVYKAERFKSILDNNALLAKTPHIPLRFHQFKRDELMKKYVNKDENFKYMRYKGVSLTRDYDFAKIWSEGLCVFKLDWRLLRRDFKIIPVNFWNNKTMQNRGKEEFEEFVFGDIKPLRKYLISIYVQDVEEYQLRYPHYAEYFEKMK